MSSRSLASSRLRWLDVEPRIARRDAPAVLAVVALAPPAVQHAQVHRAVQARLLPRGAAGLQRIFRRVQPHIDAGDQLPGQAPCRSPPAAGSCRWNSGCMRKIVDHPDQCWPGASCGCALPANMITTGRSGSLSSARQPRGIGKQHRGALVGGEAARETHHQHVGVGPRRSARMTRGSSPRWSPLRRCCCTTPAWSSCSSCCFSALCTLQYW